MDKIAKVAADLQAAVDAVKQSTADPRMTTDSLVLAVESVIAGIKKPAKKPSRKSK